MNQDKKMAISSPLSAHKNHVVTFDIVGVDVGWENPMFACLEVDYGEASSPFSPVVTGKIAKNVIFYELDLGLNHVT